MIKNIKQFLFIAGLLMIAAGAQPVGAAFWQWSTTPASNATADPTVNWSEGMSPSSVNDSGRAMMTALAKWRIDNGGGLINGGTSSAFTLATSTVYPNLAALNGQTIAFLANNGNTVGATLNVDGTGAVPMAIGSSPLPNDVIIAGGLYFATYFQASNQYRLAGAFKSPTDVPIGGVVFTTVGSAPSASFLSAAGQCISTTTYAVYWASIGSPAPGACGAGNFQLIDLRGRYLAGLDTLPVSGAAGRMTASAAGCGTAFTFPGVICTQGVEGRSLSAAQIPTITSGVSVTVSGSTNTIIATRVPQGSAVVVAGSLSVGMSNGVDTGPAGFAGTFSGSGSGSATSNNTAGTAHSNIPPTMGLYPWIRVL